MKKNKGSITVLSLLMVFVILSVAISFNWYVREYVYNVDAFQKKTEAMLKAHTTFELLNYLVMTGIVTNTEVIIQAPSKLKIKVEKFPVDGTPFTLYYDNVFITLQDINGLISLNTLNEEVLLRLLKIVGVRDAEELIETYYDWIDTDDLKRIKGAEESDYKKMGFGYRPRNYPIQSKIELSLIKGFNRDIVSKIESLITLLPPSGFNPNTAPIEVLMAVLDIDRLTAERIKRYVKEVKSIVGEPQLTLLIGKPVVIKEEFEFSPSDFFEIKIEVNENGKNIYSIQAGYRRVGTSDLPWMITYWREE